jgi:hypothetical protein
MACGYLRGKTMNNDGLIVLNEKDSLFMFFFSLLILFPLFGALYFFINEENQWPLIVFISVGYFISLFLLFCHLINKKLYFFQIAFSFFGFIGALFFGSWLVFTEVISMAFKYFIPAPTTYTCSAMIFLSYTVALFLRHYIVFKNNEHNYLKGIDFSTGIIDPTKTKLFNPKIADGQLYDSPFFLPVKLFLFVAIPLGGVGCVVLMQHVGESLKLIIVAITGYSLSMIGLVAGMNVFFSLFNLVRLQIKYKKWFQLAAIPEEAK